MMHKRLPLKIIGLLIGASFIMLGTDQGCGLQPSGSVQLDYAVPMRNDVNPDFPAWEFIRDPEIKAGFGYCQGDVWLNPKLVFSPQEATSAGWMEYGERQQDRPDGQLDQPRDDPEEVILVHCLSQAKHRYEGFYTFVGFHQGDLIDGNIVQVVGIDDPFEMGTARGAAMWWRATENQIFSLKLFEMTEGILTIIEGSSEEGALNIGSFDVTVEKIELKFLTKSPNNRSAVE
jgi:hypothetical protein